MSTGQVRRAPRSDGVRTRAAILRASAELATVDGLEGLTIGELARHIGMSKSGLYAHFGSKEELQLATIETARQVFDEQVIASALAAEPGRAALVAITDAYLEHLRARVFPGGCFFAGAVLEMGSRPGRVRDAVVTFQRDLAGLLQGFVQAGVDAGELPPSDLASLSFEINGQFLAASASFTLTGEPAVLDLVAMVVRRRLGLAS